MTDIWVPDVSEFQSVDFGVFSGPIIVRAHNSGRADRHWPQHAAGAAHQPWWGAYQYLTAGADPVAAAHAFIATIGGYSPNVVILDLEEGDGDQSGRQAAWLGAVTGHPAWTYTGFYFAREHNVHVDWVAAYQSHEPSDAHLLWQAADNHSFPGIGPCDGSIFHGSTDDLIRLTGGQPTGPAAKEQDDMPMQMVSPPQSYPDGSPHPHAGSVFIVNGLLASHVSDPEMLNLYKFLGVAGPSEISAKWFDNLTVVPTALDPYSTFRFSASIDAGAIAAAVAAQLHGTVGGSGGPVSDQDVQRIATATLNELARRAQA